MHCRYTFRQMSLQLAADMICLPFNLNTQKHRLNQLYRSLETAIEFTEGMNCSVVSLLNGVSTTWKA